MLSHALDQAWRGRTGPALTLADYERTGGLQGAVAGSAQRAYDRLTGAQQAAARQVFIGLTATTSDGLDTTARVDRADLTVGKNAAQTRDVEAVLETFAAERLLTLAAGTVEISHEALLTAWPLLRDNWLADTHADRMVRTRLHATAQEWAHASRDPSYLYSGSRLETAAETAARIDSDARHPPLSQTETDFLHASHRAHRRRIRRRQGFTAILLALVVGLAAVAVIAVDASQASNRQRDIAISGQLATESEALGNANATVSRLESLAAWAVYPSAQARYAMLASAASPEIATLTDGYTVKSVAFSPDGKTLATGDNRRHGPAVERGHRPPDRQPPHRLPDSQLGGVQPGRQDAGHRRRRPHGQAVEPGHRPPDRQPPHRLGPGRVCGVQPGRQDACHQRRRRHDPAVERSQRPPDRQPPRHLPRRSTRWRSARTARRWPPAATSARPGCGT